jgi:uncharacterized protein involved in exopolysaccharide biosynthesis
MDPFLDEPQKQEGGFDPRVLIRLFWRRKWLFIIPFILCFSMVAVVIKTMTPIYYAPGHIQVIMRNTGTDLLNDPNAQFGRRPRDIDDRARQEIGLLLSSPEFLEAVVKDLQLHVNPGWVGLQDPANPMTEAKALHRAALRLRNNLRMETVNSRVFEIGLRDVDPERSLNIGAFVINKFIEEFRADQVAARSETRDFLEGQLEEYQEELATAENELNQFMTGMAASTLLGSSVNASNLSQVEGNLSRLRTRHNGPDLSELRRAEQDARAKVGSAFTVGTYGAEPHVAATLREMRDLVMDEMLTSSDDSGYDGLQSRLGTVRVRLNSQIEELVGQDYPALGFMDRNQVSHYVFTSLSRQTNRWVLDEMQRQIGAFRDFTTQQPVQSARLAELQDRVESSRETVQSIQEAVTQQNMYLDYNRSMGGFQVKLRQKPSYPEGPVEPNKIKLLMMGFALSLALGCGLVVMAIFLDRSFSSVEQIEDALGLTVIGTLPVIVDDHFEMKKKRRILRWITMILGIIAISALFFLVIYPRLS